MQPTTLPAPHQNSSELLSEVQLILEECKTLDINLSIENGELRFRAAKGAMNADLLAKLKSRKVELVSYLKESLDRASKPEFHITPSNCNDRGLLFTQVMWDNYSERRMDVGMANISHIVIRGEINIDMNSLRKSVTQLVERQRVLNTKIESYDGNLFLSHRSNAEIALQYFIAEGATQEQREQEAMQAANALVWKEFDLDAGPLYRVFAIKISDTDHILGAVLHHTISDGIAIGMVFHELLSLYGSAITNTLDQPPAASLQYMDYLISMERWLTTPAATEHLTYWIGTLRSATTTQLLPINYSHSPVRSVAATGAQETIAFDSFTLGQLKKTAVKLQVTPFLLLLAAQKMTTWCMTKQKDQVVLVINSGRNNATLHMVGNFASEIAYKTNMEGNPSLEEVVARLKRSMMEAHHHQPIPFDIIRHQLRQEGLEFSAPVVNYLPSKNEAQGNGALRLRFPSPEPKTKFPGYGLVYRDFPDGIEGALIYRQDLDSEATVKTYLTLFRKIVSALISTPITRIESFAASLTLD